MLFKFLIKFDDGKLMIFKFLFDLTNAIQYDNCASINITKEMIKNVFLPSVNYCDIQNNYLLIIL